MNSAVQRSQKRQIRTITVGEFAKITLAIIANLAARQEEDRRRKEWMFEAPEPVWRAWLDDNL